MMQALTENLAGQYADAVLDELRGAFPGLAMASYFKQIRDGIVLHAQNPRASFEMSLDMRREWRLHREDAFRDHWRVIIHVHKDDWTADDIRFSEHVNDQLRAIKLEES